MKSNILGALGAVAALMVASSAQAATADWTEWTSNTAGTIGAVGVTYSGEMQGLITIPQYTPPSSFTGGSVDNAPVAADGSIKLIGGNAGVNSVTFSQAVLNPVFAIWSLGQGGAPASFNFIGSPNFSIVAGGPSTQFGGGSITQVGSVVSGNEANGLLQFVGSYTSISWTNPSAENYYAFTVGAGGGGAVPEPATWGLMILGFGLAGASMRARRRLMQGA